MSSEVIPNFPKRNYLKPGTKAFRGEIFDSNQWREKMPKELEKRPGFGKMGKSATVAVNSYKVNNWPTKPVYQYDLQIGSGDEKPGLIKVTVESKAFKKAVGPGFIFDGKSLGWSMTNFPNELRILIDLDVEKGQEPRPNHTNTVRVKITPARKINLFVVKEYLEGKTSFTPHILECINFLDHLLRESPKTQHINLRRSFFLRVQEQADLYELGFGVDAIKGTYQSLRMAEGKKLVINVDVTNACFWKDVNMAFLAQLMSGAPDHYHFLGISQMQNDREPECWNTFRRLAKTKFQVKHLGQTDKTKGRIFSVDRISSFHSKSYKFEVKNPQTGIKAETSLYDYYLSRYKVRIDNWHLPLIVSNKAGTLFPMDLCWTEQGQRFPYKLNENQTASMIKFAVSRPPQRKEGIERGLKMLNWKEDVFLKNYGMEISTQMIHTQARVLNPPEVQFKGSVAKPGYSGRWDLRGKKFYKVPDAPLKSWGVVVLNAKMPREKVTTDQVKVFLKNFIAIYIGHGGKVENKDPPIINGVPDTAKAIESCFLAAGNQVQLRPQAMLVILPNKNVDVYNRVKKNLDCRFGVVSQCMQSVQILKNQAQYISNVLMKFNSKLGGTTCYTKCKPFKCPTIIIGADVSHGGPGTVTPSIAAMTVSMDEENARYSAGVEANGHHVEMIMTKSIEQILTPLIQWWMNTVSKGQLAKHVIYLRDGVSEGQFIPLLYQEVADMKRLFEVIADGKTELVPKFTVIVAEKRHHTRFFPVDNVAGDKNKNPVPGVIVDKDVTSPHEYDFYLNSHSAIQGTARPTHYTVILDEMKVDVDDLQKMIYDQCYQYQRATTPVSLHPAVYYAHLAAARGIAHEDKAEVDKWKAKQQAKKNHGQFDTSEKDSQAEPPPLIKMDNKNRIVYSTWYI